MGDGKWGGGNARSTGMGMSSDGRRVSQFMGRMEREKGTGREPERKLTDRINAVINCTPVRVNNKTKVTNLMKISRIEGYNGK